MQPGPAQLTPSVVAGLGLAIVLDTCVQLSWKIAASSGDLGRTFLNPWFIVAMLGFGLQLWNWLRVLAHADLSFAQPITAVGYITVLGFSAWWLHERISPRQGIGVGLVLLGVWFISRTPPLSGTEVPPPDRP